MLISQFTLLGKFTGALSLLALEPKSINRLVLWVYLKENELQVSFECLS